MILITERKKMQKHTKVYLDFFGYDISDTIYCEMCNSVAQDIHHLERRTRNKVTNDYIENLVSLCRDCHINAESDKSFNMYTRIKHLENVCAQVYALIHINKKLDEHRKNRNK
tara:strand:+ start:1701 stop:2039 length:339 start_codon:yes stop_codon:yes gene_type:complete